MPEESKETKAKKLAAARKKLKEYQQRGVLSGANTVSSYTYADSSTNSGHVSSNISERSESELQLNGSAIDISHIEVTNEKEPTAVAIKEEPLDLPQENYFTTDTPLEQPESSKYEDNVKSTVCDAEGVQNINAIQVLITEKSQLSTELNKFHSLCREKDLEIEELRVQYTNAAKRVENLNQHVIDLQKQQEQQRSQNAELQHKLAQAKAQQEDQTTHINELQQQLTLRDGRLKKIETDFKDKCNELELSQLRIRQLSDENNITKDTRVETLTQTQFMYEQQIRDLQAMVHQLTQDKEQANTQYQTYVQQLNAQVQQLNERNNELMDETTKFQEQEKQWVDHIQQLEKEIQKNISRQSEVSEGEKESSTEISNKQIQDLKERINEFESERYEFQLKIKSQEDRLNSLQDELNKKNYEVEQLKEHLYEQPDKAKLMATMESDKVAASRALTQNVELKKQLDELQLKFVQLTNDKADLMNRLDSEQYTNREMYASYSAMEERLKTMDERFKFKDEEMIRLSHENEELKKKLEHRKTYDNSESEEDDVDCHNHKHYNHEHEHEGHDHHSDKSEECSKDNEEHSKDLEHDHHHDEHDDKCDNQNRNETHLSQNPSNEQESCQEALEINAFNSPKLQKPLNPHGASAVPKINRTKMSSIATEEAVVRLEERFTQLMTQCAELTEEKHRLEHLVTQLQSETETIGEYIALYQKQRRILKQREYEKAAQTAMLQAERVQMRERLTMLNNLVNSLGMELPQNQHLKQQIDEALTQNEALSITSEGQDTTEHRSFTTNNPDLITQNIHTSARDLNSPESQQILHKIQDIIMEIKENTKELPTIKNSVDHLNCCTGKFEVV